MNRFGEGMKLKYLAYLTIFIFLLIIAALLCLSENKLSAYGSIISAGGSLLAVVWFSAGLLYQSTQLKEQRTQFLAEFRHSHADGRRNALLLARDILADAESRAKSFDKSITNLTEIFPRYIMMIELKDIMESNDPGKVQIAIESWNKKEGAAMALMVGIKMAAEVYFEAISKTDIDWSKDPEEFVFIYGPLLWNLPFFRNYQVAATLLTEVMVQILPGRQAVIIASFAAMAKQGGSKYMKMDAIRRNIKTHLEKGYPLPEIAKNL